VKHLQAFLVLIMVGLMVPSALAQDAQLEAVLEKVQAQIRSSDYLSYHIAWTMEHPRFKGGKFKASGTVWLKKVPTDTFFGAYFHANGEDDNGAFDYFYDGIDSLEARPADKKIIIFRLEDFPKNSSHPAKFRSASMMFNGLVIDPEFKSTVLKDHANSTMHENADQTSLIITIKYAPNMFGIKTTRTFEIGKTSHRIERIHEETTLDSTIISDYVFSKYQQDEGAVAAHIKMPADFEPDYAREVFKRKGRRAR
jgi:hypothetical protein